MIDARASLRLADLLASRLFKPMMKQYSRDGRFNASLVTFFNTFAPATEDYLEDEIDMRVVRRGDEQ